MSAYTPIFTNAAGVVKDSTHTSVIAADIGTEFDNIQTAVNSKADTASPTLTTPTLGVATATSINKVTITQPAASATLTIANTGSFITSGAYAITLTATNTTGVTLPTTGTLATLAGSESLSNKTLASPAFSGTIANLGTVTTADINGGTIDGTSIGSSTPAAGAFTTLSASGALTGIAKSGANTDIDSIALAGLCDLSDASAGQIKFPASQNASSNANTLDDYKEGTWTPTITFDTPTGMSVTYLTQTGIFTKIGRLVVAHFEIITSTFTFGAPVSGYFKVTGLPVAISSSEPVQSGTVSWQGITKAGYSQINLAGVLGTDSLNLYISGSGLGLFALTKAEFTSGTNVALYGSISYITD